MKYRLGLDLGTNSIGWAIVKTDLENNPIELVNMGSRIIPMTQDVMDNFAQGITQSNTAQRTEYRGVRRLRERFLLRRERLHRILHILEFLPDHYDSSIGWNKQDNKTYGKFIDNKEPKLAWMPTNGKQKFIFYKSYLEMVQLFADKSQPIPIDWTIYYLRKKALKEQISREELAWILLQFNQKRGYYQQREENEANKKNKLVEYKHLKVKTVDLDPLQKRTTYIITFENGWQYTYQSNTPIDNWVGTTKEYIVTTDLDDEGNAKIDKEGKEKRSFRIPKEDDWTLIKKKTELDLQESGKTVGVYIFDHLLTQKSPKIIGGLIKTIERDFYKKELLLILNKQKDFYKELSDKNLFNRCVQELYPHNLGHNTNLKEKKDLIHLLVEDILFYHRPLKSKKSLIDNCPLESRYYKKENEVLKSPIKCVAKSNPLFQEFRLWQFIQNLKIIAKEKFVNGKLKLNEDVTKDFIPDTKTKVQLFDWLKVHESIKQEKLLKSFFKIKPNKETKELPYRWNYVEERTYPSNETYAILYKALSYEKAEKLLEQPDFIYKLWHILYSITDPNDLKSALNSFLSKNNLPSTLLEHLMKLKPFKIEYGSFSEKAIKRLLPLMREGKYWNKEAIDEKTTTRINHIINGEVDENIDIKVREKLENRRDIEDFQGLGLWLASYVVYNRHSEAGEITTWDNPEQLEDFLTSQFKQHSLRNPIVEQIILESLRVVKDIWVKYGKPTYIHIELGRELKNPKSTRETISKRQASNEQTKMRMLKMLMFLKAEAGFNYINPYSSSQQDKLRIVEEAAISSESTLPDDIKSILNSIAKNNEPTKREFEKYRLWIEQNYKSPYTGKMISFAELFTNKYEIEHIIPKKRFYDDSYTNKIVCEAEVNQVKSAQLGMEFILEKGGSTVQIGTQHVRILQADEYQSLVSRLFRKSRAKLEKLLATDIPSGFSERQLNDSRYISKAIMGFLSNIVRKKDDKEDKESISKYIIPCNGRTTTILKQDWELNDIWNKLIQPRFERLNRLTNTTDYGEFIKDERGQRFQIRVPFDLQKGFNKKRIDHRHHAMDALVIACTTTSHIQYLNNINRTEKGDKNNNIHQALQKKLCEQKNGNQYAIKKPWATFTQEAKKALDNIIVSHKKNTRVLTKTKNKTQYHDSLGNKSVKQQCKGTSYSIRKPLHKETIYGKVSLREIKEGVSLKRALSDDYKMIVDKKLKSFIKQLSQQYGKYNPDTILNYFKDRKYIFTDREGNQIDVKKVDIYLYKDNMSATRKPITESITEKQIKSITDSGIKTILMNHLIENKNNIKVAFSEEGLIEMNKNIQRLNGGKPHKPIYKVRFSEEGIKYPLGKTANKSSKLTEAAKGTNLFFAIYITKDGKRTFETVPLNIVIDRLKKEKSPIPEVDRDGNKLLFHLSPNDLVYVPSEEEVDKDKIRGSEIYKMVSSTQKECHFLPHNISMVIAKGKEFTSINKSEKTIDNINIKNTCWKLKVNRLGEITDIIK